MTLSFNSSQEVIGFNSSGQETTDADRNGNTTHLYYNTNGTLNYITDTEGRTINFSYTSGLLTAISYPGATSGATRSISMSYSGGYLASVTDATGAVTSFAYDGNDNLDVITDPDGNSSWITYSSYSESPAAVGLQLGTDAYAQSNYAYAGAAASSGVPGALGDTTVTDPNSHVTTYVWNSSDLVIQSTDADSHTESATYDADNDVATGADAMSPTDTTTYNWDGSGDPTGTTEPANGTDTPAETYTNYSMSSGTVGYSYLPTSSVDAQGNCTYETYDANGNLTDTYAGEAKVTGSGSPYCSSTSTYTSKSSATYEGTGGSCTGAVTGEMCSSTDADGNTTDYAYDSNGNLDKVTPPSGSGLGVTNITDDASSRVVNVEDGDGSSGTPGTPEVVQTATTAVSSSGVSSRSVSFTYPTTAGDIIVLEVGSNAYSPQPSVSSVSGGGVSTWTLAKAASSSSVGDLEIWYGKTTGSTGSVTATMSAGASEVGLYALELTGAAAAVDVTGSHTGTSTTITSPSLTTTAKNDFVLLGANTSYHVTSSPSAPWTDYVGPQNTDSNYYMPLATQEATSTGSYSGSWHAGTSGYYETVGVAFKAAPQSTSYQYDADDRTTAVTYAGQLTCGVPQSISAVGSLDNGDGSGDSSLSVSPAHVGDEMVLSIIAGGNNHVSSISGGGVGSWARLQYNDAYTNDTELWAGTVTSTGSSTIGVSWASAIGSAWTELATQEFSSGAGSSTVWEPEAEGQSDNTASSTSMDFPTLSASAASALYVGYAFAPNPGTGGSTSGYTFDLTSADNVFAYDTNVSGSQFPVATQSPAAESWTVAAVLGAWPAVGADCIRYAYDPDGNLIMKADSTGTYTYSYDIDGHLSSMTNPSDADACSSSSKLGLVYGYDPAGNLTSSCDGLGTTTYAYDAANNLTSEVEPGGTSGCTVSPQNLTTGCTAFSYDNDNRRSEELFSGGASQTVTYWPNGEVKTIVGENSSATTETSFSYDYVSGTDDQDLVSSRVESDPGASATITYGYDADNRLTSAATSGGSTIDYYYDSAGNRCSSASTSTSAPYLCPTGTGDYTYNSGDQLTSGPAGSYTYDEDGNETASPSLTTLAYDPKNQNSSVTPSGGSAISMSYTGTGSDERTTDGSTTLVYGALGLHEIINGSTTTYFIRDNQGHLIGEHVGSTSYYYLTDVLSSVIAVINSSGSVQDRYAYDPYGQVSSSSGSLSNPIGFDGGYGDSTGLVKFGTRYYDPTTGRWTQLDPSGQDAGYAFATNDPITDEDIDGMSLWSDITSAADDVNDALTCATGVLDIGLGFYDASEGAELAVISGGVGVPVGAFLVAEGAYSIYDGIKSTDDSC